MTILLMIAFIALKIVRIAKFVYGENNIWVV